MYLVEIYNTPSKIYSNVINYIIQITKYTKVLFGMICLLINKYFFILIIYDKSTMYNIININLVI